ncbi:hypothetical protein BJF77_04160 [Kocuria sp. CNJ-770]|uniref:YcnI family protein n=1 Tax=Kocuria oceani TaxID=988827 RepID=A0ABV9TH85_9MICC|nr:MULTISPECIES: YcnI family protein [Kocuria]OLT04727.1 hypothetical protein BJF77_04160 [Kocuria sp. CNJ-770]
MTNTTAPRLITSTSVLAVAAGLTALGLSPAAAHVSATSTSTAAEGYAQVTFSVPNESDTASTNKLELTLPENTPFASVRTKPVEGWSAEVTEEQLPEPVQIGEGAITEAPATITWTADEEHAIEPGQFQTFTISVGPLPEEGTTLLLPVTQSYTDGRSVAWDQPMAEGEAEPEHPAPSLTTTAAEADGHGHGTDDNAGAATAAEEASTQGSVGTGLGWAGLVAGLLGLLAGVVALVRTRRRG